MTNLEDILYYLKMWVNYVVGKKITFCQSIYFIKIFYYFKIIDSKSIFILTSFKIANSLLSYNRNVNKKTI